MAGFGMGDFGGGMAFGGGMPMGGMPVGPPMGMGGFGSGFGALPMSGMGGPMGSLPGMSPMQAPMPTTPLQNMYAQAGPLNVISPAASAMPGRPLSQPQPLLPQNAIPSPLQNNIPLPQARPAGLGVNPAIPTAAPLPTMGQLLKANANNPLVGQYGKMIPDQGLPIDTWKQQHGDLYSNPMVPPSIKSIFDTAMKPQPPPRPPVDIPNQAIPLPMARPQGLGQTPPVQNPAQNPGTFHFLPGMESRYGEVSRNMIATDADRIRSAVAPESKFNPIPISGDNPKAQLEAVRAVAKPGDTVLGFSAGGYNAAKLGIPGVNTMSVGAPGAPGNIELPGGHMNEIHNLANQMSGVPIPRPRPDISQALNPSQPAAPLNPSIPPQPPPVSIGLQGMANRAGGLLPQIAPGGSGWGRPTTLPEIQVKPPEPTSAPARSSLPYSLPPQPPPVSTGAQGQANRAAGLINENQAGVRNMPIADTTRGYLQTAAEKTGLQVDVFSGGQPTSGSHRIGSHRHDLGGAADITLSDNGRKLDMRNPQDAAKMQEFVKQAVGAGATGVGAGVGYMGPHGLHIGGGRQTSWGGAPWIGNALQSGVAMRGGQQTASAPPTAGSPPHYTTLPAHTFMNPRGTPLRMPVPMANPPMPPARPGAVLPSASLSPWALPNGWSMRLIG